MKVFLAAMACEAAAVTRLLEHAADYTIGGFRVVEGCFGACGVAVITTGVGKANAAAGAQFALMRYDVKRLYNAGTCGGLGPDLTCGETYSPNRVVQYDFNLDDVNGQGIGTLDECDEPFLPLEPAVGFPVAACATGDSFVDDSGAGERLRAQFGVGLREMELGAIAQVCRRAGVACTALKTVTDVSSSAAAMTRQYRENLAQGLENLSTAVKKLLENEAE